VSISAFYSFVDTSCPICFSDHTSEKRYGLVVCGYAALYLPCLPADKGDPEAKKSEPQRLESHAALV